VVKKVNADFSLVQNKRMDFHLTKATAALNTAKKDSNGKKKVPELLATSNASGTAKAHATPGSSQG